MHRRLSMPRSWPCFRSLSSHINFDSLGFMLGCSPEAGRPTHDGQNVGSIFKYETHVDAPMRLCTGGLGQWKNESQTRPRLNSCDRLQVCPKRYVGHNAVLAMSCVVQLRRAISFNNWNQLLHSRDRKFLVRYRIAQDKPVFEVLQPAILAPARKRRVTEY